MAGRDFEYVVTPGDWGQLEYIISDLSGKLRKMLNESGPISSYILANGTRPFTGNQSMGAHKLTNVLDPTADQDAATKIYVDDAITGIGIGDYLPLAGGTMTGNLLFTDNSYDIGASGATRPRDLFLSRNATLGGYLSMLQGILSAGTTTGFTIPSGAGTRLMWIPSKAAFRAGMIDSEAPLYPPVPEWDIANIGLNSVAFGVNNKASGNCSTCFGYYGQATNSYAAHFGSAGLASGYRSTHFGSSGTASGDGSTHFGQNGVAAGAYSTHFGFAGNLMGDYTVCSGVGLIADCYGVVVFGSYNVALGYTGVNLTSPPVGDSSPSHGAPQTPDVVYPVFVIGNGTGVSNRVTVLTIWSNGNQTGGTGAENYF